ncbi:MAG: hypothetical protein JW891_18720 [Candidatus Lokiarchaeota archaeon]|nr:hypothetical protein [Candidatus Lokiarchaeota archaeon]
MNETDAFVDKELFLNQVEKLSLKIEQIASEVSHVKNKLNKSNLMNRSFGLKALKTSQPLDFANDVVGIGSPTKEYRLSVRAISEEWKGHKNDVLIAVRQQEKETHQDLKALGIRIPINDIKKISILAKEIVSILYVACQLEDVDVNTILREILEEINANGKKMINEVKEKLPLNFKKNTD